MIDLVQRLRDSATQARALDRAALLNEAADEIERLRNQGEQLRIEVADAKKWAMGERGLKYEAMVAADKSRLRLTDAERTAIVFIAHNNPRDGFVRRTWLEFKVALLGLLERTR